MSLRIRVALLVGVLVALAMAAGGVGAYSAARNEQYEAIDDFLEERSESLGRYDAPRLAPRDQQVRPIGSERRYTDDDSIVAFRDTSGALVYCSDDELELPPPSRSGRRVYDTVSLDGEPYRMLSVTMPDGPTVQVARTLAETESTLANIRNRLWFVGLAVTALGATLGWFAARRMARPIERLSAAAERVARTNQFDGALDPAIDARGPSEVSKLAASFASMLDVLHRSRQQQQQLVIDAGHELRTPLTTLRTNVEMLQRGKLTADDQQAVLRSARAEVDELAELTNELVELATDTRTSDPPRSVDVLELAVAAADRAAARFQRPVDVSGEPAAVEGQVALLERAIDNLLENAAKFSPSGTPIDVSVAPGRIEVRDHGPGIDPLDLPHVFDRFYRANASRTLPGSGLGLAIVAKAATEHGGAGFASNADDGGAVVGFTFGAAIDVVERR